MSSFADAMTLLEEKFGNNDNLISLSTISLDQGTDGKPRPAARIVDAYYQDGCFYSVTNAKSLKMQQIANNPAVAICYIIENYTAEGIADNLGWVGEPQNTELAAKLRKVFAAWYDDANDDTDPDTCILRIKMTKGLWNDAHKGIRHEIDFSNKLAT